MVKGYFNQKEEEKARLIILHMKHLVLFLHKSILFLYQKAIKYNFINIFASRIFDIQNTRKWLK